MPQVLPGIDEIARQEGRDVLFITFHDPSKGLPRKNLDWEHLPRRQAIIEWLEERSIKWTPCFSLVGPNCIIVPYLGEIYVDVIWDEADATYRLLRDHLENKEEKPRIRGARFCAFTLKLALKIRDETPEGDDW